MVFGDDIDGDIFIEPPEANVDTDEDSADEDDGGLADNLTSRQLRAPAEIRLRDNDRVEDELNLTGSFAANNEEHEESLLIFDETNKWLKERRLQKGKLIPKWEKDADFDIERMLSFPKPNYLRYSQMSVTDIFEQFFDYELIEHLQNETKKYALFLNCPDPQITCDEIRCFIAILFISGYNNLPSKRHYWDSGDDMKNIAVAQSMRRNRFLQICRFIHCADNTKINYNDKAWKIRPVLEMLKERCIRNFVPEENLAYDESMVKYYGRHNCKQFIRGKPIRFGYKVWSLNTKDGYLVNFELYQGKSPKANTDYETLFGKAASPLLVLLDEMPPEKRNLRYHFYMDNLFSNSALFSFLTFRGYFAIGTIRENRIANQCPLSSKKLFAKKNRGYFESAIEKTDGQLYVRWMDNAVVTMLSSSCGTQPIGQVKRFSQTQKKNIMVQQPRVIGKYNEFMGGTDQMDQNVACYRIGIRGKKWYWPLFTWMLDVAMQNCWLLYCKSRGQKISQLQVRREVANTYLRRYLTLPKASGRPSVSLQSSNSRVSDNIRFDQMNHFVGHTQENKKRRCALISCKSIIRTMCMKCQVALCINCFAAFHSR